MLFYQQKKKMNLCIDPWKGNFSCGYSTFQILYYILSAGKVKAVIFFKSCGFHLLNLRAKTSLSSWRKKFKDRINIEVK